MVYYGYYESLYSKLNLILDVYLLFYILYCFHETLKTYDKKEYHVESYFSLIILV